MNAPLKILDLGFTYLEFFPNYVINYSREGVIIDAEQLNSLIIAFDNYYSNRKFGFISNRIHSYSINPLVHEFFDLHENMSVYAVVCYSHTCEKSVSFESKFITKPFKTFKELAAAKAWMDRFMENKKKAGL